MADQTFKMTKLVGESTESIESAVRAALATSAQNVHGQSWAHITDLRVSLKADGSVETWQASVEVAFKIDA